MAQALLDRIANGRTDLVFDYLALGHPATSSDKDGTRLSQWCLYYGDVSALKLLIERGETLASLGDNFELNGAAFHGHWRLCEYLIESGADPNHALPDTGETPLHAALCTRRRTARDLVVRVLLDRGANPNAKTTPGVETGAFMRDCRTKGETPLHRAAAFGGEETIDLLLAAGAPARGAGRPRRFPALLGQLVRPPGRDSPEAVLWAVLDPARAQDDGRVSTRRAARSAVTWSVTMAGDTIGR